MSRPRKLDVKYQLLLAVSILVGLFLIEYPPIFLLGYWSWSGLVHKTITGLLLVLNLVAAQYVTKRLSHLRDLPNVSHGEVPQDIPEA
jgi:hypothetical protein